MCSNFIMAGVHFIILKINGIDVCHLPHEDAVQMFLSASDPILIEVCRERKQSDNNDDSNINSSQGATTTTGNNGEIIATATTKSTLTTPTNRKKVNSASNVTLVGSPQKNSTANNTTIKKNLTLYFPPPPPLLHTSIDNENDIKEEDVDENKIIRPLYVRRYSNTPPSPAPSLNKDELDGHDHIITSQPKLISTAMQTDVNDFVSLFHVANVATTDQIIEQEHNLFEACLAPDIDIEEITLRKSDSNEHLGLTVCYSQTAGSNCGNTNSNNSNANTEDSNESCTEVYISDIQPDSIAGRDGRLRQGDQILQVNGKDVSNKKETETLIAENNNAVTLLVSRYLYTDEDDFNDTSVAGIDIEDEDEDVPDDDEDDDEYYDENNLAYENCLIAPNECVTPHRAILDTVRSAIVETTSASASSATTSAKFEESQNKNITNTTGTFATTIPAATVITTTTTTTATASPTKIQQQTGRSKTSNRTQVFLKYDPLNHQNIKAHLKQVNKELAMLDCRMENLMVKSLLPVSATNVEYDTEHIYETIPEDSESEPFYCSPYESSVSKNGYLNSNVLAYSSLEAAHLQQQKHRVAAWLGMQPSTQRQQIVNSNGRGVSVLQHLPPVINSMNDNSTGVGTIATTSRSKSGTMRSAATNVTTGTTGTTGSSSSGGGVSVGGGSGGFAGNGITCLNEHENSSSAYNTGGSNNSGTALTLLLNAPVQHEMEQIVALRYNKGQRLLSPKDKLTSPKHQSSPTVVTQTVTKMSTGATGIRITPPTISSADFQAPLSVIRNSQQISNAATATANNLGGVGAVNNCKQLPSSTMYTNVANLQQTMLLQQQLFRQALTQQQQQSHYLSLQKHEQHPQVNEASQQNRTMHTCPQFTAPNLSQYHFVSSQEVSAEQIRVAAAAAAAKTSNEEPMVWKVKRRQDGTRYIVRRPARTRILRDRALRINAERENHNELTTTEDDTISEIKTGRYWTREERKKHIERARERRQQQQQQLATTMRITDKLMGSPTETLTTNAPSDNTKLINKEKHAQLAQQQLNKMQQCTNTTKLQHHQLQFGSTIQQTSDVNAINTNTKLQKQFLTNKNNLISNKPTLNTMQDITTSATVSAVNIGSLNIAEPTTGLGVNNVNNTSTTPNNIAISTTTTTATTAAVITTISTVNSAVTMSGAVGVVGEQQQQQGVASVQTATANSNNNKLVGLLSVTTV